jgi:hypothetical protein
VVVYIAIRDRRSKDPAQSEKSDAAGQDGSP